MRRKVLSPEIIYLIIGSIFGLLILFYLPPFQAPDERSHFDKAYSISTGEFYATEVEIPTSIRDLQYVSASLPFHTEEHIYLSEITQFISIPLNLDDTITQKFPGTAVYSPVPYIFSGLAICLSKHSSTPVFIFFYLGRLFNFIASLIIGYYVLKITPIYKWLFLFLLLSPITISQSISYSADSLTNALSFLFIAICLKFAIGDNQIISNKNLLLLLGLSIALSLTKAPYAFLVGLIWIIPKEKFGSFNRKVFFSLITFCLILVIFLLSSKTNRDFYTLNLPFGGVDPDQQVQFIFKHPVKYLIIVLRTIINNKLSIYKTFVGVLGWLDTPLPSIIYLTYLPIMLLISIIDIDQDKEFFLWQKLICIIVGLTTIFVVITGLYITWTPIKNSTVDGLVGRYLIPLSPTLLFIFYNKFKKIKYIRPSWIVPIYSAISLLITFNTITQRYYY